MENSRVLRFQFPEVSLDIHRPRKPLTLHSESIDMLKAPRLVPRLSLITRKSLGARLEGTLS